MMSRQVQLTLERITNPEPTTLGFALSEAWRLTAVFSSPADGTPSTWIGMVKGPAPRAVDELMVTFGRALLEQYPWLA